MPADSTLHAFTLSPALPRLGGGSTWVAVLQDVMIYEKRFSIPLSKCHSGQRPLQAIQTSQTRPGNADRFQSTFAPTSFTSLL